MKQTIVYCWYQCSSIIIGDSARRIRIIILTCIDTNRFESLRHPRSPLNGEIYPRHIYVKRVGLADILWKAGVACYGTPVTTAGRVHRESTKNVYSLLRKIRLTSYVGLNAGIVYNSDPTSRISNFHK